MAVYKPKKKTGIETTEDIKIPATMVDGLNAMRYAVCSTAASTAIKTVSCSDFALNIGECIAVKFDNANTASSLAKLNVNGTGARSIIYKGTNASSTNTWVAGEIVTLRFDGSFWRTISVDRAPTVYNNGTAVKNLKMTLSGTTLTITTD